MEAFDEIQTGRPELAAKKSLVVDGHQFFEDGEICFEVIRRGEKSA
jgi:hypothetical protein